MISVQDLSELCVFVCVCNHPPVCEVYPNCEVLVLQTCTVPSPYIGSIAIVTSFISFPPAPPDSTLFLGHYFTSSILTPPPHQHLLIAIVLFMFAPSFHLQYRIKAPPTWTLPAPATHQPLQLISVPCAMCLHLPPFL